MGAGRREDGVDGEVVGRRVIVHGRVQGVGFRDSTRRRAEAEGVRGWVRNRGDGTVEAVLEGSPAAVERVLGSVRTGPRGARVDHVEVVDEAPGAAPSFRIAPDA
jgi:acylphosphatase